MEEQEVRKGNQIEIMASIERETAEFHLKRLNWFFDQNPDLYLIQKPRTTYDEFGTPKTTVRYEIRKKGDQKDESGKTAAADQGDQGRTGTSETGDQSPDKHIQDAPAITEDQEGESNHEKHTCGSEQSSV